MTTNLHTARMKKAGHSENGWPAVVLSSGLLSGGGIAALRLGRWLILLHWLNISSAQDPFKHAQGDHGYLGLIAPGQNDGLPEDAHFSGKFSEIRAGFRNAEVAKVGQLHALSIQERWIVQRDVLYNSSVREGPLPARRPRTSKGRRVPERRQSLRSL